ncbi:MAG TPA: DUF2382 domain-containing protein [Bryobacteraceae bacterium]|nr:DUF2382 domain-containing protein [Bryobacteraceae bacterium]
MSATDIRKTVVPLAAEELSVSKRVAPQSRVQVSRTTHQRDELVELLLARERVEIERTTIGKPIDAIPPVREEGDTIIIPVVEEVVVVERRLVLKEEVRIRRIHETELHQERVTLRAQEATITRVPVEDSAPSGQRKVK